MPVANLAASAKRVKAAGSAQKPLSRVGKPKFSNLDDKHRRRDARPSRQLIASSAMTNGLVFHHHTIMMSSTPLIPCDLTMLLSRKLCKWTTYSAE